MNLEEPIEYENYNRIFFEIHQIFLKEDSSFHAMTMDMPIGFNQEHLPSFVNPYFILAYNEVDGYYYISFTINKYRIETVAHYMHLLTLFLYDRVRVWADNWVDIKTGMIYFGDKAYHKYEAHVLDIQGVTTCTCCEKMVPKEFVENGICKICTQLTIPAATFH